MTLSLGKMGAQEAQQRVVVWEGVATPSAVWLFLLNRGS